MNDFQPVSPRFWTKVAVRGPGECWTWKGATKGNGYGMLFVNGRSRTAHRVAWELANGQEIPAGMDACHRCDNPPCVNPDHIFVGTRGDNMQDAWDKGRMPRKRRPKTHCIRGHDLTLLDNYWVRLTPKGPTRVCKACKRARDRRAV